MTTALLVPCYNAARFLPRLRAQVDRMAPAFDEVLLADDASKDDTAALAESMGFRILRLPKNLGPGGARNALVRASSAEWVHFHDVDDEIAPDYLVRLHPVAKSDVDIVFHSVDFLDETTRAFQMRWAVDPGALAEDPAIALLLSPMPTAASLVRRAVFLAISGFHETRRCFEDGDLNFRLAVQGARLASVPDVLVWSLRRNDAASSNQLYCFQCRLGFLEDYASALSVRFHPAIAREAERAATMLMRLQDQAGARRAITLARRLGRKIPTTAHPLLKLLRPLLPATTLLRWQDRWRQNR